ncbi:MULTISPECIES: hypothetical protein [Microbacterium]|uniref:DUF2207 domain-containing protein n=2 Tax=Microbacterium TaxID=33882 RepID=A0ABX5SZE9_9MICO|nr:MULTISPECIES: hypothetical protein [Microbacterium]MCK6066231.1 hypothetical protein [Microbacterium sp. EYE_512]QBR90502.1 hypothetical protein E4K62_18530 [Microbacterium wangchenii]TFV84690.1 hypothetical protein E4V99_06475 [Microbacterium sp. dk485]TXK14528.1 hypothetical protein FVP99_12525 [Microbacterium wangchenii]
MALSNVKRKPPLRLPGDDATIARLAARARAVIAADPSMTGLLTSTSSLARERAKRVAVAAVDAEKPQQQAATPVPSPDVWIWLAGVGIAAVVVSAAMMYAPLRGVRLDQTEAVPLMLTSSILAIVALGAAALLRPPARDSSGSASVMSVIAAGALVVVIGYRTVVGTSGGTAYSAAQLQLWFVFTFAQLALLIVVALRARRAGARAKLAAGVNWRGDPEWRRETKRLLEYAATLARTQPDGTAAREDLRQRWEADLAETTDVPADVLAEARAIGPGGWLVWAAYDGEIDISAGGARR